ncbi:MAG: hypothetical protein MUO39_10480 [Steroidobacteraceae bacterium]|nr:hypothetical protein [Steroidobacteraceae bacterium]
MKRHKTLVIVAALALPALLLACPADAAARKGQSKAPKSQEAAYRCRDANGRAIIAQSIPAECMDADIEVLDNTGRVLRIIPGREALAEIEAQKAAHAAMVAAANHDKTLLATYLSVEDIERLRDQRLELLVQQGRVTDQYVANLKERESRLAQDVQRYRPYSDRTNAPPLPDHIAEDIVNTVNGLQVYQQELAKNLQEQQELRDSFDADIARFKELKGIK